MSSTQQVISPEQAISEAQRLMNMARINLEQSKLVLIEAVKSSGAPFMYVSDEHLYVGPDRHNADWVVTWDEKASRAAASQMLLDNKRTCNWDACLCKRNNRGRFQSQF